MQTMTPSDFSDSMISFAAAIPAKLTQHFLLKGGCTQACPNGHTLQTDFMSQMASDSAFGEHCQVHERNYFIRHEGNQLRHFSHLGGVSPVLFPAIVRLQQCFQQQYVE